MNLSSISCQAWRGHTGSLGLRVGSMTTEVLGSLRYTFTLGKPQANYDLHLSADWRLERRSGSQDANYSEKETKEPVCF